MKTHKKSENKLCHDPKHPQEHRSMSVGQGRWAEGTLTRELGKKNIANTDLAIDAVQLQFDHVLSTGVVDRGPTPVFWINAAKDIKKKKKKKEFRNHWKGDSKKCVKDWKKWRCCHAKKKNRHLSAWIFYGYQLHRNGASMYYVMVFKLQWKPFWLATQLSLQIKRMTGLDGNFVWIMTYSYRPHWLAVWSTLDSFSIKLIIEKSRSNKDSCKFVEHPGTARCIHLFCKCQSPRHVV